MDYVNLMAYDMVQSDSSVTGLLAPLSIIVSIYQTIATLSIQQAIAEQMLPYKVLLLIKVAKRCSYSRRKKLTTGSITGPILDN